MREIYKAQLVVAVAVEKRKKPETAETILAEVVTENFGDYQTQVSEWRNMILAPTWHVPNARVDEFRATISDFVKVGDDELTPGAPPAADPGTPPDME